MKWPKDIPNSEGWSYYEQGFSQYWRLGFGSYRVYIEYLWRISTVRVAISEEHDESAAYREWTVGKEDIVKFAIGLLRKRVESDIKDHEDSAKELKCLLETLPRS